MLCINPFRPRPGVEHGCGQCMGCRINRRRALTGRIQAELLQHVESSWCTLTYADEHLPLVSSGLLPTLSRAHTTSLLRNFGRELVAAFPLREAPRFFLVGEYGEKGGRPHYHLVIFGMPWSIALQSWMEQRWLWGKVRQGETIWENSNGFAAYLAGYVTKKLSDGDLEEGQEREFIRCSRNPPIGWVHIRDNYGPWFASQEGQEYLSKHRDVPSEHTVGKRYPLGPYLKRKLRDLVNVPHDDPVRQAAREARIKAEAAHPVLGPLREAKRVARYEVTRRRAEGARRRRN